MAKKAISLPILSSFVVGNMIGTGIYILPSSLAKYGTISLLSWIYTSFGTLLLCFTFIVLSKRFTKTGGPYVYCREAFGNLTGFLIAFIYWLSNLIVAAGLAISTLGYLGFLIPIYNANNPATYNPQIAVITELIMIWLFTLINMLGIQAAGIVQLVLTIIKIIPLILIALVGIFYVHVDNLLQFNLSNESNLSTLFAAATVTFWAFIGFETATIPAENTQGYKDIYKATLYGTILTCLIYILCSFVLMGIIPSTHLKTSQFPFAEAGIILFGPFAALVIAICAVISGLGTLNVTILVQGQIIYAAARDNLISKRFAKLSKNDAPIMGQFFSSIIITGFILMTVKKTLLQQFDTVALTASLFTLITYFVTTLAELKFLFINKQKLYKIIFSQAFLITMLAAMYSIWMISSFTKDILIFGLIALFISIVLYFFLHKKITEDNQRR